MYLFDKQKAETSSERISSFTQHRVRKDMNRAYAVTFIAGPMAP